VCCGTLLSKLPTVSRLSLVIRASLDKALVQNIMRLDMAILQESPWYQQILSEGEQQGEKRGILAAIELGLELKFGADALELMESISEVQDLES
jgi:predicted transposase YdaD